MIQLDILGPSLEITPAWYERMEMRLSPWCDVDTPGTDGVGPSMILNGEPARGWGCYRQAGHSGRHLGIVSQREPGGRWRDFWAVWG